MAEHLQLEEGSHSSFVCITEKWIRKRLHVHKTCLNTFQSLVLPGSYFEKITHLGRSLLGFYQLKHLDLSRNSLTSLQGLEHLRHLESLNLYYNKISSLNELFRLRHNSALKELDVRLNPVTHIEPDYRIFVIHMLTDLRQLDHRTPDPCPFSCLLAKRGLDDTEVLDTERSAALKHFNTSQAFIFDSEKTSRQNDIDGRDRRQKEELQSNSAMQDNTEELLELTCSLPETEMTEMRDMDTSVRRKQSELHHRDREENKERLVRVNFTPVPQLPDNIDSHYELPPFDHVMQQLVEIVQRHVKTDIGGNTQLKAELHHLWYMTWKSLKEEVYHLREKLDKMRMDILKKNTRLQLPEKQISLETSPGVLEHTKKVEKGPDGNMHYQTYSMLQESHRCLLATNDYLLRELEKVKHSPVNLPHIS